jgi:choline dehydrogenase-like flavoprotein
VLKQSKSQPPLLRIVRRFFFLGVLLNIVSFWQGIPCAAETRQFDLAVYGGTAGGIAAAIAASRQGLQVVLIEPTHHIGGMVSGGLSHTDIGNPDVIGGISREVFERIGRHYGEQLEWNFEPHVADQVFHEMLMEAKVAAARKGRRYQATRSNRRHPPGKRNRHSSEGLCRLYL